jgi:hypothetical protein
VPRSWTRRLIAVHSIQTFEAVADAAVHQERLARDELADLVTALAGPARCCLIVEGVVIALADDADGMAVVREDRVVRI